MVESSKTSRALLTSATRASSTATAQQTDPQVAFLRAYLNVSAVSGTGGLSVVFRGYDKISGNSVELTDGGDSPVNQTGTYCYEMGVSPDPPLAGVRGAASRTVPYQWDALVKHADGSNYTYSLSIETQRT